MAPGWSEQELEILNGSDELLIATPRANRTWSAPVPVWVVVVGAAVYVRTWYRRQGGWYGRAASSKTARIQIAGTKIDVTVDDVGGRDPEESRAGIDAAYRAKYGGYGVAAVERMAADDAAATTLRLVRS